ncbi:MAG: nucleotide exchange factor GrpE [Myxococcales bacterium]|jgi:molecular chaperone GrpE|nr:nucleotide exchange factor GrpE [Myxococcales bacterium]
MMTSPENEDTKPVTDEVAEVVDAESEVAAEPDDELFIDDFTAPEGVDEASQDPIALALARATADLAAAQTERDELKEQLLRKAADFENMRRRHQKEREEQSKYAGEKVLKDVVSLLDDLDRALEHVTGADQTGMPTGLLTGIQMVHRRFVQTMEKHGVTVILSVGQPFDPHLHEAISQREDATVPRNTVVQEFQKAYMLNDRLLRPAMVVVSTGGPSPDETGPSYGSDA